MPTEEQLDEMARALIPRLNAISDLNPDPRPTRVVSTPEPVLGEFALPEFTVGARYFD